VFGFLGPNGAGKTTTINMLCTLLSPTSGRASVNGHDVTKERSQVRRCIGLVFQDPTLDGYLTAEQNMTFHAYAYGVPREARLRRMQEVLILLELWDRKDTRVSDYSGGMKRRLEIARGLLHRPRVLFLDEPTLGLDPQSRRSIWEYILKMREQEKLTLFLTTHYMDEAEHCDRIAVIDHGRIVALDTPENLKNATGGDVVTLRTEDNAKAVEELRARYGVSPKIENGNVQFSIAKGDQFLPEFVKSFPLRLLSVGVRRPTLDDVFISLTGRAIREQEADMREHMRHGMMRAKFGRHG
jgi:ABC-2 type transport system ATP-binding protein